VSLEITNRQRLVEQLQHYEADLVVMGEPPATLGVDYQRLMPNPLVLIAAPNHLLAKQSIIPFEQVAKETFVIREEGSGTRAALERLFQEHQSTLYSPLVMSSNESIKYSVMAGLGLGVVSLHSIQLELASNALVILPAEGFPIERYWYIVHRAGRWLSPAAQAFETYMIERATGYSLRYS
jgi:DNA-binding transcriptional LysR family regulator